MKSFVDQNDHQITEYGSTRHGFQKYDHEPEMIDHGLEVECAVIVAEKGNAQLNGCRMRTIKHNPASDFIDRTKKDRVISFHWSTNRVNL